MGFAAAQTSNLETSKATVGAPNFLEPVGTFGILTQGTGWNHKMAAAGDGISPKRDQVMYNSDSNSSTFQAEMSGKLHCVALSPGS